MAENANVKKPGFFARIGRFFKDVRGETKRVIWPDKKQVLNNTGIVLIFVAIATVVVSGLDVVFSFLVKLMLKA